MISRHLIVILLLGLPLALSGASTPINQHCPIMPNEEVDADSFLVEHDGKTYGFCCRRCVNEFHRDPDYWVALMADSTEAVTPLPAPVSPKSEPPRTLISVLGRFHVVAVHFPIALVLVAAGLAWWHTLRAHQAVRASAVVTTHLSAIAALLAVGLGWLAGLDPHPDQDMLNVHRWTGTSAGIGAIMASLMAGLDLEIPKRPKAWLGCLSVAAVLTIIAGHWGGMLVFGPDHLW